MKRVRLFGLAVLAMVALSAATAAAAQATEGPYYSVSGKRLPAGETKEVKVKAVGNFVLRTPAAGTVVTCTGMLVGPGATTYGFSGANPGTSKGVVEFSGCTVTGNGEKCGVEHEEIKTNTIKGILGYSSESRTGPLLVLFEPSSGTNFVTVKFTGTCTIASSPATGSVIGEVAEASEKTVNTLKFTTTKKTIWLEEAGKLTSVKAEVKADSLDLETIEGEAQGERTGKPRWSVLP